MNLPTWLTVSRILLVPVFVAVYLLPGQWTYLASAALFGLAASTDWLDGYLARRLKQATHFGAFLDPVADKLIVISALILLVGSHASLWLTLPAIVIVGRELVISALREWMAEMNRRGVMEVLWLGRMKTTLQMMAIIVLLAIPADPDQWMVRLGYVLLYTAALLTLWSMAHYLRAAWPVLKAGLTSS